MEKSDDNSRSDRCALKQARRETLASADLADAEIALIEAAEIPEEHRYEVVTDAVNDFYDHHGFMSDEFTTL